MGARLLPSPALHPVEPAPLRTVLASAFCHSSQAGFSRGRRLVARFRQGRFEHSSRRRKHLTQLSHSVIETSNHRLSAHSQATLIPINACPADRPEIRFTYVRI